jgi:hypothetical protein
MIQESLLFCSYYDQGSKLTFQPASQTGLIDCNFYQSAEKLFSPPHKQKIENTCNEKMEQNKMPFSLIKDQLF